MIKWNIKINLVVFSLLLLLLLLVVFFFSLCINLDFYVTIGVFIFFFFFFSFFFYFLWKWKDHSAVDVVGFASTHIYNIILASVLSLFVARGKKISGGSSSCSSNQNSAMKRQNAVRKFRIYFRHVRILRLKASRFMANLGTIITDRLWENMFEHILHMRSFIHCVRSCVCFYRPDLLDVFAVKRIWLSATVIGWPIFAPSLSLIAPPFNERLSSFSDKKNNFIHTMNVTHIPFLYNQHTFILTWICFVCVFFRFSNCFVIGWRIAAKYSFIVIAGEPLIFCEKLKSKRIKKSEPIEM